MNWKSPFSTDVNSSQADIQVSHSFYQNSSKIFGDILKIILKFMFKVKAIRVAKTFLKKKK